MAIIAYTHQYNNSVVELGVEELLCAPEDMSPTGTLLLNEMARVLHELNKLRVRTEKACTLPWHAKSEWAGGSQRVDGGGWGRCAGQCGGGAWCSNVRALCPACRACWPLCPPAPPAAARAYAKRAESVIEMLAECPRALCMCMVGNWTVMLDNGDVQLPTKVGCLVGCCWRQPRQAAEGWGGLSAAC